MSAPETTERPAATSRDGRSWLARAAWAVGPAAGSLVLGLVGAELLIRILHVPSFLLPAPSAVFATLIQGFRALGPATGETGEAALAGFALSGAAGVGVAILLSASRLLQRAFYPHAVFFQTVPVVAIAPLLVIWFGPGLKAVIASSFIVSVFPVIANALAGLRSTDPALLDLFRLCRAGPVATLLRLRLPAALPAILTGLRVSAGLAVVGAIVGEFVAGGGLGTVVRAAIPVQRPDLVFAAVLCASALGLALFGAVGAASTLLLRGWHPSERD